MIKSKNVSAVRSSHLPNWLRLAWIRARKPRAKKYCNNGWAILDEIGSELREAGVYLDHHGSAMIQNQLCFINEPYATVENAYASARIIAEVVGAFPYVTRQSYHGFGTVRAIVAERPLRGYALGDFLDAIFQVGRPVPVDPEIDAQRVEPPF